MLRLVWVLLLVGCVGPSRFEFVEPAMGTTFRLVLYAEDEAQAGRAAAAAFARIHALDGALSDYQQDSELSRLSASSRDAAGVPRLASADLAAVLAAAAAVSAQTEGAFDVTVGPYVRLWRRAARQGVLPSAEHLAQARSSVGWQLVDLDGVAGTVTLRARDMRLDLGGIAKGYALDEALATLGQHGVRRALVDGGGDVAVAGPPPGAPGWRVALDTGGGPEGVVLLAHAACATSGDTARFVEVGGVRYSHVVDPRTGLGVSSGQAATVIAPSGMLADAWASALCVLEVDAGLALVESREGLEARVWQKEARVPCDTSGFTVRMVR